ncbi:hypothetical protein LCGC14_0717180 [marine sediment metagenome]|uniref:Response regulator receiver modulated diguanylate cyclase/phosphodiesterase n=1 Tax=marine sediment metagenome TaxID=412755 RepID=A0A0F9SYV3_9ZZZZ
METYFDAHILIVDDNPTNVLLLKALLESSGYYNLASTTDPRTVLQHITENTTDLLILDIRMPFLNGFDVMALLSKQLGDASPPVVVMTAQIDEETRKKAFEYGALNFLTKPFDHDEVLKRINNILAIQYRNKKSTSQAQELQQLVDSRTEELQALSLQEPLTGLPNRRALKQEMQNNIAKGKFITVMFIVIDNVNVMANVHGYQVLEKLLCHISQLLKDCFNDSQHYLSSWGSYEFVLMSTCNDPGSAFISAEKITDILQDIHTIDNLRLQLNGRVGLCDSRTEYKDVLDLIDFAAIALPNFKEQRRYRFYETKLRDVLRYKQNILTEIRSARFGAGLSLVYQAKVDLASGQVKSAEALLRFNSRLGQLSPADFIPLAEESGDILFIGDWVINQAISQLETWLEQGLIDEQFSVAVNVSTEQLMDGEFAQKLLVKLDKSSINNSMLQLEVTESSLMRDVDKATKQLKLLASRGVKTAIDDFGTGYSSLAYLSTLPVNLLKIDRIFISDIETNKNNLSLVETVLTMAKNFNCQVVAEGIETQTQSDILSALGCEFAQGYFFSRPVPPQEFLEYYQQHRGA